MPNRLLPREEEHRALRPACSRAAGDLWSGRYLTVFTLLYGLSFTMPFWTDVPVTTVTHDVQLDVTPDPGTGGNLSHQVWRYSWEYTGLAMRCLTLLLLLVGCGVSLHRTCSDREQQYPPPSLLPILCGVIAGVMGIYAEVVLWLGVSLLAPNQFLMESQVFCSITSVFCFLVGLAIYWSRGCRHHPVSVHGTSYNDPTDVNHVGCIHVSRVNDFYRNYATFGDASQWRSVATGTEEAFPPVPAQDLSERDDHHSDPSEEKDLDKHGLEEMAPELSCHRCPPEDLPDDLKRLGEDGPLEHLPDYDQAQSEDSPSKEAPDDLLLNRDGARSSEDLNHNSDFDHHAQFIDDDLYYHSSDDDHLERFIRPGSSRLQQQQETSEVSLESKLSSSSAYFMHTGRAMLLLGDSDEFHSLSDDDSKNKTWP